jgi:hypothetical protein
MDTQVILQGFDVKKELIIQLISLSTAILALSIAFIDVMTQAVSRVMVFYLKLAWIGFFLAIVFGILALMAIAGTLLKGCTYNAPNILALQIIQIVCFGISTVSMLTFGMKAIHQIFNQREKSSAKEMRRTKSQIKFRKHYR